MAKALYVFNWVQGRGGSLDGMFVAEEQEVIDLIGKTLYFGEVLGKHSEVQGNLHDTDVKLISRDQGLIAKLIITCKSLTMCGYNPLEHHDPEC